MRKLSRKVNLQKLTLEAPNLLEFQDTADEDPKASRDWTSAFRKMQKDIDKTRESIPEVVRNAILLSKVNQIMQIKFSDLIYMNLKVA